MELKNKLIGGLATIVLSASSGLTLGQDQNFLKFRNPEPNVQNFLKFKPKNEIEQTPEKYLKTFMRMEPNIIIYNVPKNILIEPRYNPEPNNINIEKYDKLRWEPSTGNYK